ncbi:gluconolactonase [Sphingomonas japonica]|uniref:Gluconolactonase n=2 Tax=Sphingomonas japonica TaxID=511662 RepID=A0ABX0TZX8_9SPHN|nr:gluconolactonase [Sphingomonas japonica]
MTSPTASRRTILAAIAALPLAGCAARAVHGTDAGGVERLDPALDRIIPRTAHVETIATGYRWAEGPVWNARDGSLLFSDVPANVIHRWVPGEGARPWLDPSGLAGPIPAEIREAGANGLAIDRAGSLVMGDSGSRTVARLDMATRAKTVLADRFEGKRFNSPNDVALAHGGAIYFTDPPYGLAGGDASPVKELAFNGVYRLASDGAVTLIDDGLSFPNGIALSPDERTLYVSISDPERPELLAYPLDAAGRAGTPRRLFDFRAGVAAKQPGLPDGMTVDARGTLFATGPGGVHVLTPDGRLLGRIATGVAIANCAIGAGYLYLASSDRIARIALA